MKTNRNILASIALLSLIACGQSPLATTKDSATASSAPDLSQTAIYVLQRDNRMVDFTTAEFQAQKEQISKELAPIFATQMTDEGRKIYSQNLTVATLGKVDLLVDTSNDMFAPLFPAGTKKIDLVGQSVGDPAIDQLLANYGATTLELTQDLPAVGMKRYEVRISTSRNPLRAAAELKELARERFSPESEMNWYTGHGQLDLTRKTSDGVVTYTFAVGMGDCPAGCIGVSEIAFKVNPETLEVTRLGTPDANLQAFFK